MSKRIPFRYSDENDDWAIGTGDPNLLDADSMCHSGVEQWFDIPENPQYGDYLWVVITKRPTATSYRFRILKDGMSNYMEMQDSAGDWWPVTLHDAIFAKFGRKRGYVRVEFE